MKVGIIGAMQEEVSSLIVDMNIKNKLNKASMVFNEGTIYDRDVVIVVSGIGKVNAAICTQILIDEFDVDAVINVGIAGGIGENVYPGDVVIAEDLVQHDMDAVGFGYPFGQIPRMDVFSFKCDEQLVKCAKDACDKISDINVFTGRIVSGDQFVADVQKIRWLKAKFDAISCEMEGASIAHVAHLNNKKFVIIRSISDNADNGAHMDYDKFEALAVQNSNKILRSMLQSM